MKVRFRAREAITRNQGINARLSCVPDTKRAPTEADAPTLIYLNVVRRDHFFLEPTK